MEERHRQESAMLVLDFQKHTPLVIQVKVVVCEDISMNPVPSYSYTYYASLSFTSLARFREHKIALVFLFTSPRCTQRALHSIR